jgi:hypothetical protein
MTMHRGDFMEVETIFSNLPTLETERLLLRRLC